jgi:hypothetical protein
VYLVGGWGSFIRKLIITLEDVYYDYDYAVAVEKYGYCSYHPSRDRAIVGVAGAAGVAANNCYSNN